MDSGKPCSGSLQGHWPLLSPSPFCPRLQSPRQPEQRLSCGCTFVWLQLTLSSSKGLNTTPSEVSRSHQTPGFMEESKA